MYFSSSICSLTNTTKSANWYFLLFLAQLNRKYLPKRIRWLKVWSEVEPLKTPYKISRFVRSLILCLLHNDRYHIVDSFQKDTANEQFTNKCGLFAQYQGKKGQVGESIFFILLRRLLVVSKLWITLNWNTDNLTSFVTAKRSEYTLRRCNESKTYLMSLLSVEEVSFY